MARPAPDPSLPLWARPSSVAVIVLAIAVIKLWVAGSTELVFDEGYYTLWSLQPSWGYLDHPPMVAWLIALGRAIAGENEIGVRLMSILGDIAVAAAIYRIGRLLFDARTAALAAIWHAVSIGAALGLIMTPDAPSILCWTLTLWAVAEFIGSKNANWWLVAGVFAGLGLESKLTNGFLAFGLLLFLISSRERRSWFGLWQVWAAPVVAALVFSPLVIWNRAHNWVTFWFQGRRTIGADATAAGFFDHFVEMVAGQALAVGPALLGFSFAAGVMLLRRRGGAASNGLALGLLSGLPTIVYFIVHATHSRVELNWLLPVWAGLTLCGAWAALALRPRGLIGGIVWTLRQSQVVYGISAIAVVFTQAVFFPFPSVGFDRTRDMHGFRDMTAEVLSLAHERGARWIVIPFDYGVTGQLGAYAQFAGDPLPVHQLGDRLRYVYAPPLDADALGWPALYVSGLGNPSAPVPPDHFFGQSELVSVIERKRGNEVLGYYQVYLVSEPTAAFRDSARS